MAWDALTAHSKTCKMPRPRQSCLFWGKYLFVLKQLLPTLSPVNLTRFQFSFLFHNHLSDRSFACPSALRPYKLCNHIVSCNGSILPSPTKCEDVRERRQTDFLGRRVHLPIWLCKVHIKYIPSDWFCHQTHLRSVWWHKIILTWRDDCNLDLTETKAIVGILSLFTDGCHPSQMLPIYTSPAWYENWSKAFHTVSASLGEWVWRAGLLVDIIGPNRIYYNHDRTTIGHLAVDITALKACMELSSQ